MAIFDDRVSATPDRNGYSASKSTGVWKDRFGRPALVFAK
jgi:hypothetical protein